MLVALFFLLVYRSDKTSGDRHNKEEENYRN